MSKSENLIDDSNNDTMQDASENDNAGNSSPEDALSRFEKIIENQNRTIEALMSQNQNLTEQMTNYIRITPVASSANSDSGNASAANDAFEKPDDYEPLESLGKLIGKKES